MGELTLEQAKDIVNKRHASPLSDAEWALLFAAEALLKEHKEEVRYGTYDE